MNSNKLISSKLIILFLMIILFLQNGCVQPTPSGSDPVIHEIELQSPYQNFDYWYKSQTHVHSNKGNPSDNPQEEGPMVVEQTYRSMGYNFIFLTDHNNVTPDPKVGCSGEKCILHVASGEDGWLCRHHMIVLGVHDPDLVRTTNTPCISGGTIQERIDTFLGDGALVVLAHPKGEYKLGGTSYELDELANNTGYTGIEIWTPDSNSIDWWDALLKYGREVWGFASDDCENLKGGNFNRAWLMVNTDKGPLTDYIDNNDEETLRQDIKQSIKTGNFYAVVRGPNGNPQSYTDDSGPMMTIWTEGAKLRVLTDKTDSKIRFISGCRFTEEYIDFGAGYTATGSEGYIRVEVEQIRDGVQYIAYSQPIFIQDREPDNQGVEGTIQHMTLSSARITFTNECLGYVSSVNVNHTGRYHIVLPAGRYKVHADDKYHEYDGEVEIPISGFAKMDFEMHLKPGVPEP